MAVHRGIGEDLVMYNEMFMASPDGQAERERVRKVIEQLPDATQVVDAEFTGYFLPPEY